MTNLKVKLECQFCEGAGKQQVLRFTPHRAQSGRAGDPGSLKMTNQIYAAHFRNPTLAFRFQVLTEQGRRPADSYFRVERLYAQKKGGSIP